jgi:hypothetical protein
MPDLHTTNVLLGIMAAASVLEGLLLIGLVVGGFVMYRRVMTLVTDLEARQVAPLREKVDAILTDVHAITARVSKQTASITPSPARSIAWTRRPRVSARAYTIR